MSPLGPGGFHSLPVFGRLTHSDTHTEEQRMRHTVEDTQKEVVVTAVHKYPLLKT